MSQNIFTIAEYNCFYEVEFIYVFYGNAFCYSFLLSCWALLVIFL